MNEPGQMNEPDQTNEPGHFNEPQRLDSLPGLQWLARAVATRPLIALDYDGTLAPLVDDPDAASIDPRARRCLVALRERFQIAVVSGRGLADLQARVGVDGLALVGSHGNKWPGEDNGSVRAQAAMVADWADQLRVLLEREAPQATLEIKRLSLTLHYRDAAAPTLLREQLAAICERLHPVPKRIDGKFVWNLIPPDAATKFEAIERLLRECRARTAIFVGDDATDEIVFERAPPDWLTVKVFDGEAGLAVGARTAARASVDGIDGVIALLERLAHL